MSESSDAAVEFHDELLQTRDELIAAEARLGDALGRIRVLEADVDRYRLVAQELQQLERSRSYRLYQRLHRIGSRATRFFGTRR